MGHRLRLIDESGNPGVACMSETSASLLDRLRDQPDDASWQKLVDLYTPLIRGWLRRQARLEQDAEDLVQEVLAVVVRKLPQFRREPRTGAFRRWLRTITVNCLREFWRSRKNRPVATGKDEFLNMLEQLEDPNSGLSHLWDQEHDRHVTQRLLDMIKPRFEATTWQAFHRVAVEGAAADLVAAELGISLNAVFIAKSRVLSSLRQEGEGLID
jgi:RNA polymerase sigma-70 factor (ECF subfamily)